MDVLIFPVLMILVYLSLFVGWVSNIIWTFQQTELVPLVLGILGAAVAPIGAIHGLYVLF